MTFFSFTAASSAEILEAVRNKELQKLIYNLDSSLDAENVSTIVLLKYLIMCNSHKFVVGNRIKG